MAQNKTQAEDADPIGFIGAVADAEQRSDAYALCALMARLSGEPARMWGPSIIGFGRYRYRYDSGREGESCRIGFSPRAGKMVVYLMDGYGDRAGLLARLGKHRTGKSCLYIKRLRDVDMGLLEEMIGESLAYMAVKYPVVG